jgi:hypothetical protein
MRPIIELIWTIASRLTVPVRINLKIGSGNVLVAKSGFGVADASCVLRWTVEKLNHMVTKTVDRCAP